MGGSSKKQTVGYKYYLGFHMAFCHGPIDAALALYVDMKLAWAGRSTGGRITISKPKLFGGEKREGGVSGALDFEQGGPTQEANDYLSGLLSNVPGFRGIAAIVARQCYVGMNPYLKHWAALLQRIYVRQDGIEQWYPEKAGIPSITSSGEVEGTPEITDDWTVISTNVFAGTLATSGGTLFYKSGPGEPNAITSDDEVTPTPVALNYDGHPSVGNQGEVHFGNSDRDCIMTVGTSQDVEPKGSVIGWIDGAQATYVFSEPTGINRKWFAIRESRAYFASKDAGVNAVYAFAANGGAQLAKSEVYATLPLGLATNGEEVYVEVGSTIRVLDPDTLAELGSYDGPPVQGYGIFCGDDDLLYKLTPAGDLYLFSESGWSIVSSVEGSLPTVASNSIRHPPKYVDGVLSWEEAEIVVDPSGPDTVTTVGRSANVAAALSYLDMNPSHIIRECLTDPDWGMGYQEADVDDAAFAAAADKLYAESMGISILWDRQIPLEDFIREILRHIDAALYVDRTSGKFVLKLIRDDYVEASLPVFDESNVDKLDGFTRRGFDELVNSVSVGWEDSRTARPGSLQVQDIAQVQMQGAVINTTVNYPGFSNRTIAGRAASRDLKALSSPLISCTLYANRDAADLNIGSVFKLSWVEYDLDEVVMRVTGIALGDGRNNLIRIQATQDTFALPDVTFAELPDTGWVDPSGEPTPAQHTLAFEVPYYELVLNSGQAEVDALLSSNPDIGYVGVAAVRPTGAINAQIASNSGPGYEEVGSLDFCPSAVIDGPIGFSTVSVAISGGVDLDDVTGGTHFQIGDEICVVSGVTDTLLTFERGALDTVPAEHAAGARVFFWDAFAGNDPTEYTDGETVALKVLPANGSGEVTLAQASEDTVTLASRAARPYPPGNVTLNGEYYPTSTANNILVEWAHRDRTQQTSGTLFSFLDASIGPEVGTTYTVRLIDAADDSVVTEQTGLSGVSATLVIGGFSGAAFVELLSLRDGLESWQMHRIPILVDNTDVLLTEAGDTILTEGEVEISADF